MEVSQIALKYIKAALAKQIEEASVKYGGMPGGASYLDDAPKNIFKSFKPFQEYSIKKFDEHLLARGLQKDVETSRRQLYTYLSLLSFSTPYSLALHPV